MNIKFPKLPKKFKEQWVAALRSRKFKQGDNYLKRVDSEGNEKFCCLGVAKEIVGAKGTLAGEQSFISMSCSKIPKPLRGRNKLTMYLAAMNDGGYFEYKKDEHKRISQKGFAGIANWIEKTL